MSSGRLTGGGLGYAATDAGGAWRLLSGLSPQEYAERRADRGAAHLLLASHPCYSKVSCFMHSVLLLVSHPCFSKF